MASPVPRSAMLALGASAFLLVSMLPAVAQVIEVPAVAIGPVSEDGWFPVYQGFAVGAGGDGGFAIGWLERHTTPGGRTDKWALVTEAFTGIATSRRPAERFEGRDESRSTIAVAGFSTG